MPTKWLRSLAQIPLFLIARTTTPPPLNLLDLPDELLEHIIHMLRFEDRIVASLTCRKLNNLIPPLNREDDRRLTDPTHPRYIPGPISICRNTKIKRLFDRPHDTTHPRWCLICYCYRPAATFLPSGDMVCHLHNGAERSFATSDIPDFLSDDLYDIVAQLKRTHTDAHYIEVDMDFCVHCRTWRECVHDFGCIKWDPQYAGHCRECGMIDVKVYITPDPASDGGQASLRRNATTSRISHGGYTGDCAESVQNRQKREFIGIPGVGMLDRRGRKWMPVYEVQSWETANGKKFVLVLRLQKVDADNEKHDKNPEDGEVGKEDRQDDTDEKDHEHDRRLLRRALHALIGLQI